MQGEPQEIVAQLAEAILTTSADAILATDPHGIIRFWNPGAVRIFGYAAEEATGSSLDLIIPERLRQRHWEGYRRVVATGVTRYGAGDVLAVPALAKDGRQISVEFTILLMPIARLPAWPRSCVMSRHVMRRRVALNASWRSVLAPEPSPDHARQARALGASGLRVLSPCEASASYETRATGSDRARAHGTRQEAYRSGSRQLLLALQLLRSVGQMAARRKRRKRGG
jgi:PAS domain S-box-containing protein